jgi:hypothetical protein
VERQGTLAEILHRLQSAFMAAGSIDDELWCIDGTIVRAHRCVGGGGSGGGKKGNRRSLAITR